MQTAGPLSVRLGWLTFSGRLWTDLNEGSPVYFYLHGFAGSGDDCHFLRSADCTFDRNWVSVDWIGHGRSSSPDVGEVYGINWQLEGLQRLARLFPNRRRILVGYSMGARLAIHAGLRCPGLFDELILISATAGIEDNKARNERRLRDQAWAEMIRREGLTSFAQKWEKLPVIASQESMPDDTRIFWQKRRRTQSPSAMAHTIQALSPGIIPSVWHQLDRINCPVKVFAGGADEKYAGYAARLVEILPKAELCIFQGLNHCLHMEDPPGFLRHLSE